MVHLNCVPFCQTLLFVRVVACRADSSPPLQSVRPVQRLSFLSAKMSRRKSLLSIAQKKTL